MDRYQQCVDQEAAKTILIPLFHILVNLGMFILVRSHYKFQIANLCLIVCAQMRPEVSIQI